MIILADNYNYFVYKLHNDLCYIYTSLSIYLAYIDTGSKFNIITVDWSHIAENIVYPAPAIKTEAVGRAFADFLDRLIDYTGLKPVDIHLIGHSLGAHVVGAAGAHLKSGKVGRITGKHCRDCCNTQFET